MKPEQYKEAAQAIFDLRWILAATLSSADILHTKESKKRMADLSKLREALERQGMELAKSDQPSSN